MSKDVFLCHNSMDKPIIRRLGELLRSNGLIPWIDEKGLDGGVRWQDELAERLLGSQAVLVCCGPNGPGPWQKDEISILIQERKKTARPVIPLVLPTCSSGDPDIPIWLRPLNRVDLRHSDSAGDPFGKLLTSIDGRGEDGRFRPKILIVKDKEERKFSADVVERLVSQSASTLHLVQVLDYAEPLLHKELLKALLHTNVVVSLLSQKSYDPSPIAAFRDGIATGVRVEALNAGAKVIQWRHGEMQLPTDLKLLNKFRTPETESCLVSDLVRYVSDAAESHFQLKQRQTEQQAVPPGQRRAVLGYPVTSKEGKKFVREVRVRLAASQVICDTPPKWEQMQSWLRDAPTLYQAIVVVLTGDDDWLSECAGELWNLQRDNLRSLPQVRAFLHKADDQDDADLIPIQLEKFCEYFGLRDLPKLTTAIVEAEGGA